MKWSLWGLGMGLWGSPELTRVHPSPSLPGAFSNLCIQAAEGLAGPCLTLDRWEWGTPSDPRETQRVGGASETPVRYQPRVTWLHCPS